MLMRIRRHTSSESIIITILVLKCFKHLSVFLYRDTIDIFQGLSVFVRVYLAKAIFSKYKFLAPTEIKYLYVRFRRNGIQVIIFWSILRKTDIIYMIWVNNILSFFDNGKHLLFHLEPKHFGRVQIWIWFFRSTKVRR